jgi:AraC-like DNA-binding protein
MNELTLTDILTIVTAFQLLLLSAVILTSRRPGTVSQRLLAGFLLANFLLLAQFGLYSLTRPFRMGASPFYFLLAPLLYLYVRSLLVQLFRLNRSCWWHAVPFVLALLYALTALFIDSGQSGSEGARCFLRTGSVIGHILLDVQIVVYLILIFRTFLHYRREIRNHFADVKSISLNWLLFILMAFTMMWLTDFTGSVAGWMKIGSPALFRILTLSSVAINFIFATILVYRSMEQSWEQTGIVEASKYTGSGLTEAESSGYARKIRSVMESEKLYLDPEISLKELSDKTGITPRYVSQVINSKFNQNFFDFINQYRIEEAKRLMAGTVRKEITVLEVMYHVGFNSKSSFQAAFRKYTGTTPTEFRHRTLN